MNGCTFIVSLTKTKHMPILKSLKTGGCYMQSCTKRILLYMFFTFYKKLFIKVIIITAV